MSRLLGRLGVVLATAGTLVVGGGSIAAAHVSVHADDAVQGGTAEIAFRVPTESDTASTTTVLVAFPADTPIATVAVLPVPGWTASTTRTALPAPVAAGHGHEVSEVVSQIEWRATGQDAAIGPGEYQVFRVAGALPRADQLVFKVVQTYDDGQVQRWIEEPVAGGPEPEHPAPVLALTSTGSADHHGVAPVAAAQPTTPAPAWWAAVTIALVAMVAALGAVLVAVRTVRRRGGGTTPA